MTAGRRRRVGSWGAMAAAAACLILAVARGVSVLSAPAGEETAAVATKMVTSAPKATPAPAASPEPSATPEASPAPAEREPETVAPNLPASTLGIPSAGIELAVEGVNGFTPGRVEGTVEVPLPASAHVAGHWKPAADLAYDADGGVTLIAAHVIFDGAWGPLRNLAGVEPGATIWTTDADGGTQEWSVSSIEHRDKSDLPQELFAPEAATGDRQLVVVTCGGPVDPASGHHTENVLLTAIPVG